MKRQGIWWLCRLFYLFRRFDISIMRKFRSVIRFKVALAVMVFAFVMVSLQGCSKFVFGTEYQAVFLDNGQIFFGKLSETNKKFLLLTDVFYVQSQVNQETKQVSSILIKRGKEWHEPSFMRINTEHVVIIEPVAPGSKVQQLIVETNKMK